MEFNADKLLHGLKLIKQSVQLVIAHPVLLVYGICSFVISYGLLSVFRSSKYSLESHLQTVLKNPDYYNMYKSELLSDTYTQFRVYYAVFTIIVTFIMLFFLACVAHHAMHKLQHETHGFKDTLPDVIYKLPKLSVWFTFKIALYIFWAIILMHVPFSITTAILFIGVAVISYLTSLVLPILATEETGIFVAIKRSSRLVCDYFLVFISIFLVFNLLSFINILAIRILFEQFAMLTYTIFYYEYYARPKPELADIFYPDV